MPRGSATGSFTLKTENEIRSYIKEILQEGTFKLTNDEKPLDENAFKYFRQTSDQRFRLYYILSKEEYAEIVKRLTSILPTIKTNFRELQKDFPDHSDTKDVFDWAFNENIKSIQEIEDAIFNKINTKVSEYCNGTMLKSSYTHYQFTDDKIKFIERCKKLLASEEDSISPVIEYARIQGNLLADWLTGNEVVLIDGEGIGHDTREATQLAPRHYDYFRLFEGKSEIRPRATI